MRVAPAAATLLLAVLLSTAAAAPARPPGQEGRPAGAAAPAARDTGALRIPDVPFVAQTPALCGGASVAMVLRYWGERGVRAEDFRPLVTGRPAGITTTDLMGAVRERGWVARRIPGSADALSGQLEAGRPVIALIRVAPERFHYVVVLAVASSRVLYHDPARGPYRVLERGAWEEARSAAEGWAAVLLPGGGEEGAAGRGAEGTPDSIPSAGWDSAGREVAAEERNEGRPGADGSDLPLACASLVRDGVRVARDGNLRAGRRALRAAADLCPDRPEPWSELAGLRFRREDYDGAARLAARAARLSADGGDPYPWRLLGTARYLAGDRDGALRAWNRIGAPAVDHVRIQGLRRTGHRPALDLLDLSPGTTLTPGRLLWGRRRLEELPALRRARVDYRALEGDRAEVRVAAWERSPPTASLSRVAAAAARALAGRTLELSWPSPAGGGEALTGAWRWTPGRPRISVEARAPGPGGVVAVWGVEGSWERQSYDPEAVPPRPSGDVTFPRPEEVTEGRWSAGLSAADWLTGRFRGRVSAGYDRWTDGPVAPGDHRYLRTGLGATWRTDGGGWTAGLRGAAWLPLSKGRPSFRTLEAELRGRVGEPGRGVTASLRGGFRHVTDPAPLALWPGAGTGRGREPLLRAHPLLEEGRIAGPAFGRSVLHGGAETTAWLGGFGPLRAGVAGFVDGALAADRAAGWPGQRAHVDAGTGLRLRVGPGGGTVRLDAAVGLRDGRTALSVGWTSGRP